MKKSMIAAAILAVALPAAALPAPAQAAPAARFLQDAVSGDNAEIALGRLAQQRGASRGVIEFGRQLESDHSAARTMAMQTAREARVRVRSGMIKPEAVQLRRRLARLSGPRFDREFAVAMARKHRAEIARFEQQRRTGDPATRDFAAEVLPHLHHHLDMAMALRTR